MNSVFSVVRCCLKLWGAWAWTCSLDNYFKHFQALIIISGGKTKITVLLLYLTAYRILSVLGSICYSTAFIVSLVVSSCVLELFKRRELISCKSQKNSWALRNRLSARTSKTALKSWNETKCFGLMTSFIIPFLPSHLSSSFCTCVPAMFHVRLPHIQAFVCLWANMSKYVTPL